MNKLTVRLRRRFDGLTEFFAYLQLVVIVIRNKSAICFSATQKLKHPTSSSCSSSNLYRSHMSRTHEAPRLRMQLINRDQGSGDSSWPRGPLESFHFLLHARLTHVNRALSSTRPRSPPSRINGRVWDGCRCVMRI
jgi:hypothetical protein